MFSGLWPGSRVEVEVGVAVDSQI